MEKWRKLEQQEMEKWWRRAQGQDSDAHGETTQVQEGTHAASGKECTREREWRKGPLFHQEECMPEGRVGERTVKSISQDYWRS